MKIKFGTTDSLTKERIWKEHSKSIDEEEHKDSDTDNEEGYEMRPNEDRDRRILDLIEERLDDNWHKDTKSNDDELEGIVDYLELQEYNEFTNIDDEAYEQRRCRLLRIPYKRPSPILSEKFEVIRYSVGPDENFTKIESPEKKELVCTSSNVAWIRHHLMKEMDESGQVLHQPT